MGTKKFFNVTTAIFLVFFFVGMMSIQVGAEVKPITLILSSSEMSHGAMGKQLFIPWFDEIEKKTGGRVKIEPHWWNELGSLMEVYTMTEKGIVDIAQFMPCLIPGKFVMDEIMTLSPYTTSTYRLGRVYWELHKAFPEIQAQYSKTKILWKGTLFQTGLGTMKKKVSALEDMKGMRIIGFGDWHAERLKALGAVPQSIAPPDTHMSAARGLIDGFSMPAFMLDEFKHGEVTSYVTLMYTNQPLFAMVMNLKKWNSLPADIQKIFEETGEALVDKWDEIQKDVNSKAMKTVHEKYGTEFIEVSKEELARWDEADKTVQERYVADLESKGLPGKALRAKFLKLLDEYAD